MTIAWEEPLSDYRVPLDLTLYIDTIEDVIAAEKEKITPQQAPFGLCTYLRQKIAKKSAKDAKKWDETVQIGSEFEGRRAEVLKVLKPHHNMRDGHLGKMIGLKHCIELIADVKTCRFDPIAQVYECITLKRPTWIRWWSKELRA